MANPGAIRLLSTLVTSPVAIDPAQLTSWLAAKRIWLIGISSIPLITHNLSAIVTNSSISAVRCGPSPVSASVTSGSRMTRLGNVVEKGVGVVFKTKTIDPSDGGGRYKLTEEKCQVER